jgi:hypothetical protein
VVAQSYDELEWHLRRLRYARREGKLVFLLGAGINTEYGLPDWSQMLVALTEESHGLRPAEYPFEIGESKSFIDAVVADPLLQAASIRGAYATSNDWLRALDKVLKVGDKDVARKLRDRSKPLARIARMVRDQYWADRSRHVAVLTFNFDDLLEEALRFALGRDGHVLTSVSNAAELSRVRQRPGVFVYHLHGSLATKKDSDVVLDAYEYVQILAAPANHWSWACMNAYLFQKDAGVIFIGLSLLDPSLWLLLTQSAANGMPLSAIFVGKPLSPAPPKPSKSGRARSARKALRKALSAAWVMHDMQKLFDNLLEELSLVPYHVTAWSEIGELLDRINDDD